jgi:hypothetical protein
MTLVIVDVPDSGFRRSYPYFWAIKFMGPQANLEQQSGLLESLSFRPAGALMPGF